MPGSEGLLLKRSTSSYREQILSDLHYDKVLNFYVSTTLIKYLLRRIRSIKCTRNNWDFLYILQKSLYSTKNYIIRDLFLRESWRISCSLILESERFRACNGWILRFIQSNMTASLVNIFCLKMAIRSSSSEIWLSSTSFLFHSGHWIGAPGVIDGKLPNRFSIKNHLDC